MIMLFIDEVQCSHNDKNYFGLGILNINSNSYKKVKLSFENAVKNIKWDAEKEFKGECIFSATNGDQTVSVDERINLTEIALGGLKANTNARAKYSIFYNRAGKSEKNYIDLLVAGIKTLPKAISGSGKDLIFVALDEEESFVKTNILKALKENIRPGYTIVEEPYFLRSRTGYCGLVLVDILNYLKTWTILNPSQEKQLELFYKGISDKKKIKVQRAKVLLSAVKNIKEKEVLPS